MAEDQHIKRSRKLKNAKKPLLLRVVPEADPVKKSHRVRDSRVKLDDDNLFVEGRAQLATEEVESTGLSDREWPCLNKSRTVTLGTKSPRRQNRQQNKKNQTRHQRCPPILPKPRTPERCPPASEASDPQTYSQGSRRNMILRQWAKRERMAEKNDQSFKRKRPLGEYPYVYRQYRLPTVLNRRVAPFSGRELKDQDRRTLPVMSKFDVQTVLQNRLKQLWQGHSQHPDCPSHLTKLTKISEWELFNGKLEGEIIRKHPNGDYERWRLSELRLHKTHVH